MTATLKYALSGAALVTVVVAATWPFLDAASRSGLLLAAAVTLPVQAAAFSALVRFRDQGNGFLAVWIGGTFVRMTVVAIVAMLVIRSGADGGVATLLALSGFFFGLLLLEPVYFRPVTTSTADA